MPTIVCPQCENDSTIQRVSAVVAGGTSTGSFSGPTGAITFSDGKVGSAGGYTTLSGVSSTNLAKMLAMPLKPQKLFSSSCLGSTLVISIVALSLIGIWMVLLASHPNYDDLFPGCTMSLGIVFLLIGVILIITIRRRDEIIETTQAPQWETYKTRWEQLYYCHKHGIVFDPETGRTCEPSQLKDFVNELIKDQIIKPPSITGESL